MNATSVIIAILGLGVAIGIELGFAAIVGSLLHRCVFPGLLLKKVVIKRSEFFLRPLAYRPAARLFTRSKLAAGLCIAVLFSAVLGFNTMLWPYSAGRLYSVPVYWVSRLNLPRSCINGKYLDYIFLWWEEPAAVSSSPTQQPVPVNTGYFLNYFNITEPSRYAERSQEQPFPSWEISTTVWRNLFLYTDGYNAWKNETFTLSENGFVLKLLFFVEFIGPGFLCGFLVVLLKCALQTMFPDRTETRASRIRFSLFVFIVLFQWAIFLTPYFSPLSFNTQAETMVSALFFAAAIWIAMQFESFAEPYNYGLAGW